jgi:TatD DNase family protein
VRLIDTHCHLDDEQFAGLHDQVVSRAVQSGVEAILTVGTTAESSSSAVVLAQTFPNVFAAVGIQPNYCGDAKPDDWDRIVQLSRKYKVLALGETGLDRYWDHAPFPTQQDYFDRHLGLSQQLGLPFIVHMRDCEEDILIMLRQARARGPLSGVMHSFTGSEATAEECLELGLYISFAGMVTYKKSEELRRIASQIPEDRILIETDAPYLSPHPHRSQRRNEPAMLVHTARCLAAARGTTEEQFAGQSTANARRLFRIPD